jgi:hypothetical protein
VTSPAGLAFTAVAFAGFAFTAFAFAGFAFAPFDMVDLGTPSSGARRRVPWSVSQRRAPTGIERCPRGLKT